MNIIKTVRLSLIILLTGVILSLSGCSTPSPSSEKITYTVGILNGAGYQQLLRTASQELAIKYYKDYSPYHSDIIVRCERVFNNGNTRYIYIIKPGPTNATATDPLSIAEEILP